MLLSLQHPRYAARTSGEQHTMGAANKSADHSELHLHIRRGGGITFLQTPEVDLGATRQRCGGLAPPPRAGMAAGHSPITAYPSFVNTLNHMLRAFQTRPNLLVARIRPRCSEQCLPNTMYGILWLLRLHPSHVRENFLQTTPYGPIPRSCAPLCSLGGSEQGSQVLQREG